MRITRTDKLIIVVVLISMLAIGLAGNITQHLRAVPAPLKAQINYQLQQSKTAVELSWPSSGQAAIGAKGYGVLTSSGSQTPAPTASIAKIITILAVLKVKPIASGEQGPILTIGQSDVDIYHSYASSGGSVSPVVVGEQLTEYQVLQAMLLPSANNLADSLAIWAFGSLTSYSSYANRMLANYGLKNTVVGSDASGYSPSTTSTASDLVMLGEIASDNPVISAIASQPTATLPVAGLVKNVNWLLGTNGINGLKTGNSDQAGGAYLFTADYSIATGHSVTIVGAVLKSSDLLQAMTDASALLKSAQQAFSLDTAIAASQVIGSYQVAWGSAVSASASSAVKALAWQGKIIDKPVISLNGLKAPVDTGTVVGNIQIGTSSTSVKLDQPITAPSLWWRLTHN